jgi:hypothetical protein
VPSAFVSRAPSPVNAFQHVAESVLEHALARELYLSEVGDHRAGLRPDQLVVEVELQDPVALHLEKPLPPVLLCRAFDELADAVSCHRAIAS